VRCGFEVTFVTSSEFKTSVEDIGCSYVGLEGKANISEKDFSTEPFSVRYRPDTLTQEFRWLSVRTER